MPNQTSANAAEPDSPVPQSSTARTELEMTDLGSSLGAQEESDSHVQQIAGQQESTNSADQRLETGTMKPAASLPTSIQNEAPATASEPTEAPAEPEIEAPSQSQAITDPTTLKVGITLLMPSGHRSEWRFDKKYLEKRNVSVPEGNPFKISVYTLKELMLREWHEEWGAQPMSPSAIRLITLGKLLDDKATLEECRFMTESLTILHMTVKPQDMIDEEDARMSKHGGGRDRDGTGRTPRCRCVIL